MSKLIHTWRDLLLPNEWDTGTCTGWQNGTTRVQSKPSTFVPSMFSFDMLPARVRLVEDFPFKMQEDPRHILDSIRDLPPKHREQASRARVVSVSSPRALMVF